MHLPLHVPSPPELSQISVKSPISCLIQSDHWSSRSSPRVAFGPAYLVFTFPFKLEAGSHPPIFENG